MSAADVQQISFSLDFSSRVVKTVETVDELFAAVRLRGESECDEFDLLADHVVVTLKGEGRVVGACRLLCSRFTERFSCARELGLRDFFRAPGVKLEVGRVCFAADVPAAPLSWLLWRGVSRYAGLVGAERLFGCSADWEALIPPLLRAEFSRTGFLTALAPL